MCESVFILHVPVAPLRGDGVLLEKSWDPGFVPSLPGLSPLSLLQNKLLLGGPHLVPIHDGAGHMLPQSVRSRSNIRQREGQTSYFCFTCCEKHFKSTFPQSTTLRFTFQTQTPPAGLFVPLVSLGGCCGSPGSGSTTSPVVLSASRE